MFVGPWQVKRPFLMPTVTRRVLEDSEISPGKKSITPESSIQLLIKVSLKML
jgi:hypothetical protein